jgi:glycosyltransferase involved in cell wall biosynthesis
VRLVIDGHRLTADRTGVGRCLEGLLAEWAVTGWPLDDVILVARDPRGLARVPKSPGMMARVVGEHWPGLLWETLALRPVLQPPDLLLAPANVIPWNWRGSSVLLLYDTLPWSLPSSVTLPQRVRFGWRYRLAARRASRIIVPSESTARDVVRVHGVSPARIQVAYPGPEPFFRPLAASAPEVLRARAAAGIGASPFFLFVGKRSRRRNIRPLLEAFASHRSRFPEHRLVFVGPGGGEPLPTAEAGVVDAGHVSEETLHGLLAAALALFYPSDYEGFGLPVVEAQACGCPVVTLRNSALAESGGEAAWYLESAHPGALSRAMDALAIDPALRARLSERGRANVARFHRADFAEAVKDEIRRAALATPRKLGRLQPTRQRV